MAPSIFLLMPTESLIAQVNALLPQTQCTRCGYEACQPYAKAIVQENETINRCPPGGKAGIEQLAQLLQRPILDLDPECGSFDGPSRAVIIEEHCIGCTLCIQACPVDAIVGANKLMHTVLAQDCTGCELCIPPCPVDCIVMVPTDEWSPNDAQQAAQRYSERQQRLTTKMGNESGAVARTLSNKPSLAKAANEAEQRQASIADALARARARRAQTQRS